MEYLLGKSEALLQQVSSEKTRFLMNEINWENRLIGIKGARGTGKTTLILQYLKELDLPPTKAAYFSLDDLYFTTHELADTIEKYYKQGGSYVFLDEVHKYTDWARHLKNIYDFYPQIKIVFTGSSIIDIARQEVDLTRRVRLYDLPGLSFREFLNFQNVMEAGAISLDEIVSPGRLWKDHFPVDFRPLEFFNKYLQYGYYPFYLEDEEGYHDRIQQLIRIIVEYDLAELHDFDVRNAKKLLQLLYILAANVPFKPNLSQLARKTNIHRNTISSYLYFLEQSKLIHRLYRKGISTSILQKPEKIYLDNTNLAYALSTTSPNKGNLRETFFVSQAKVKHHVNCPFKGDFILDDQWTFEIGRRGKTGRQIQSITDSFIVSDDAEFPVTKLPLWIFGFLY